MHDMIKEYSQYFNSYKIKIQQLLLNSEENDNTNKLNFVIPIDCDNKIIHEFIKDIYKNYKNNETKIKINYLAIEYIKENINVDNPDYNEWNEKFKTIQNMSKDNPNALSTLMINMPSKSIMQKNIIKKINVSQLNESYKNIDTLYLRQNDKIKLLNILEDFRDRKDMFPELGIQYKLNVLLHGLPGTGKSTSIMAIATYLKKDIYYINLENVQTNEDLHMLFDYVNKNVPNGGIIVIEDIDAQTEIVKHRFDVNYIKETKEINTSKLNSEKKSNPTRLCIFYRLT
jgi:SpoVK/Ycf46/Vps4 family AAA+-type ATPase